MTQMKLSFDTREFVANKNDCAVVDLFCGLGGVTHGFHLEGLNVVAGLDIDEACRYAYETNNPGSKFINANIATYDPINIANLYPHEKPIKIMIGCAPCQPFSTNNSKRTAKLDKDKKWELVEKFGEVISTVQPHIVSMENVPNLMSFDSGNILNNFLSFLRGSGYHVSSQVVECAHYGVPQTRKRLVVLASKLGHIEMLPGPYQGKDYLTVEDTIKELEEIQAGELSPNDPLHKARNLDELNLQRIMASSPGGTWEEWPDNLRATCHTKESGKTYKSVYGRMEWNKPAPTITAQFYAYGSGRFGHPTQNRALSLREGALLQTFPRSYEFAQPEHEIRYDVVGKHIGNAVPVQMARWIAKSILHHLGVK